MKGHRYCQTMFCESCICRAIAQSEEISEVLSDPANCAEQRARLHELVAKRRRLVDEAARMGLAPVPVPADKPTWPEIHVGDRVRVTFSEGVTTAEGPVEVWEPPFISLGQGAGRIGGIVKEIEWLEGAKQ
jgi:hypothetical protein